MACCSGVAAAHHDRTSRGRLLHLGARLPGGVSATCWTAQPQQDSNVLEPGERGPRRATLTSSWPLRSGMRHRALLPGRPDGRRWAGKFSGGQPRPRRPSGLRPPGATRSELSPGTPCKFLGRGQGPGKGVAGRRATVRPSALTSGRPQTLPNLLLQAANPPCRPDRCPIWSTAGGGPVAEPQRAPQPSKGFHHDLRPAVGWPQRCDGPRSKRQPGSSLAVHPGPPRATPAQPGKPPRPPEVRSQSWVVLLGGSRQAAERPWPLRGWAMARQSAAKWAIPAARVGPDSCLPPAG